MNNYVFEGEMNYSHITPVLDDLELEFLFHEQLNTGCVEIEQALIEMLGEKFPGALHFELGLEEIKGVAEVLLIGKTAVQYRITHNAVMKYLDRHSITYKKNENSLYYLVELV